jgi:hypothetical protein
MRLGRAVQHDELWTTRPPSERVVAVTATARCNWFVGSADSFFVTVAFGFAMKDRASVVHTTAEGSALDDGLVSLVQWRLRDPAWSPSFADLLEDVRTCIDPAAQPGMVLAALRDALQADDGLAARARTLAIQAQRLMAGRDSRSNPPPKKALATSALRRLAEMRPAILGG